MFNNDKILFPDGKTYEISILLCGAKPAKGKMVLE